MHFLLWAERPAKTVRMYLDGNRWKSFEETPNSTFLLVLYPLCTIVSLVAVRDSHPVTLQL